MKRIKKVILSVTILSIGLSMFPINVSAYQEEVIPTTISSVNNGVFNTAQPYAHIIGWRYKTENGKVYRRQYNYSLEKWIGEWELC